MDKKETMGAEAAPPVPDPVPEKEAPAQSPQEAMAAFIRADAEEFRRQYPQVDLGELDADPLFRLFCGSRYGREPLADLYGDYLALTEQAGFSGPKTDSRRERATGSGGSGGGEALTAEEQRELSQWNRAYPHMKMSAREFLRGRD